MVHFWADWAPQCNQMDDVMKELARDMQFVNVIFMKVGWPTSYRHVIFLYRPVNNCISVTFESLFMLFEFGTF